MYTNVLNLEGSKDGNRIKQGDLSVMRYILTDANSDDLQLNDKPAKVYLTDSEGVKYIYDTTVKEQDGKYLCDVIIDTIIPAGTYTLEIWVDNTYCFPSDNKAKIRVESSVLGNGIEQIYTQNLFAGIINYAKKHSLIDFGTGGSSNTNVTLTEEDYKKILEYGIENGYFKQDTTDTSNTVVSDTAPSDTNKLWINVNGGK